MILIQFICDVLAESLFKISSEAEILSQINLKEITVGV